jgi:hypothetical protein
MLAVSMLCAVSGIVMDARVMGLMARAASGRIAQAQLERADEIATLLLFFTMSINAACLLAVLAWALGATNVANRRRFFVALAGFAIPLGNPFAAFLVRGYEDGLWFAIVAKALAMVAALSILVLVARGNQRRSGR